MSTKLFPERVRCAVCRKKIEEATVLGGMYCSLKCGKYDPPIKDVMKAPRGCKRVDSEAPSGWSFKKSFASEAFVPEKYKNDPATNVYECDNCHRFHMGHARPDTSHDPLKDRLNALAKSPKELGLMIRKYREAKSVTVKDVATVLKVTQKQIHAVENGDPSVPFGLVFRVLDLFWLKVGIQGSAPRRGLPPRN